jgi:hypothetical protein
MNTIDGRGFGIALAIGLALSVLLGLCNGLLTQGFVANAEVDGGVSLIELGSLLAGLNLVLACVTGLIIGAGMGIGYVRGGRREWMVETSGVVTGLGAAIAAHTVIIGALSCTLTVVSVMGMAGAAGDEIGVLLGRSLGNTLIPLCASVVAICVGAFPAGLVLRPKM